MNGTLAIPTPRVSRRARRRIDRMRAARAFSVPAWILVLLIPYWWMTDWYSLVLRREIGAALPFQIAGVAIFAVAQATAGAKAFRVTEFVSCRTWSGRLTTAFFGTTVALSAFSISPLHSAAYAAATWGVFVASAVAWQNNYNYARRGMQLLGVAVLAYLVVLFLHHGFDHRTIGGIQPNQVGKAAFIGVACCFFYDRGIRWVALAMGLAFITMVSSRGALVAVGVFVAIYFAPIVFSRRGFLVAAIMAPLVGVLVFAVIQTENNIISRAVSEALLLDDRLRGLGTGLTGRSDHWADGLHAFLRRPLIGYGFDTRGEFDGGPLETANAHSGLLNLILDTGLAAALLMLSAIAVETIRRVRILKTLADSTRSHPELDVAETVRLNKIVTAYFAATMVFWLLDPSHIHVGFVASIMFIYLFCAPTLVRQRLPARRA